MTQTTAAVIIGGIIPAIFFGLSGVFAKPSTGAGIGTGPYLLCTGFAIAAVGVLMSIVIPDRAISLRSGFFAVLVGLTWAVAAGLVAFALTKYGVSISRLVPLYNMNTLVAILIGLIVFAEWRDVNAVKLVFGSVLIVAGGVIVATS